MSLLPYAVQAVQRGHWVFPVQPGDKTPHRLYPNQPYTVKWSELATNDLNTVIEWWGLSPMANIGIAAKQSGLLIIDCDMPKDGSDRDGMTALVDLCITYGVPVADLESTHQVRTGSGGLHIYYRWPPEIRASQASLIKGLVDIRCNGGQRGGYVLGPGSKTTSGEYAVELDAPVQDAPPWLLALCREQERAEPLFVRPRGTGSLSGLVRTVEQAPDGNLNNALLWAARAAAGDGIPIEDAIDQLGTAYVQSHGRGGERQAEWTIRSGYKLQQRKGIG